MDPAGPRVPASGVGLPRPMVGVERTPDALLLAPPMPSSWSPLGPSVPGVGPNKLPSRPGYPTTWGRCECHPRDASCAAPAHAGTVGSVAICHVSYHPPQLPTSTTTTTTTTHGPRLLCRTRVYLLLLVLVLPTTLLVTTTTTTTATTTTT